MINEYLTCEHLKLSRVLELLQLSAHALSSIPLVGVLPEKLPLACKLLQVELALLEAAPADDNLRAFSLESTFRLVYFCFLGFVIALVVEATIGTPVFMVTLHFSGVKVVLGRLDQVMVSQ